MADDKARAPAESEPGLDQVKGEPPREPATDKGDASAIDLESAHDRAS
jgi:hypothetical protein